MKTIKYIMNSVKLVTDYKQWTYDD